MIPEPVGPYKGLVTGIESAIKRCQLLKELGTNAYVMLNIDSPPTIEMKHLKRWANRKALYWAVDFSQYKNQSKHVSDIILSEV